MNVKNTPGMNSKDSIKFNIASYNRKKTQLFQHQLQEARIISRQNFNEYLKPSPNAILQSTWFLS